eukprot:UN20483
MYKSVRKKLINYLRRARFREFNGSKYYKQLMTDLNKQRDPPKWPQDIDMRLHNIMTQPKPKFQSNILRKLDPLENSFNIPRVAGRERPHSTFQLGGSPSSFPRTKSTPLDNKIQISRST